MKDVHHIMLVHFGTPPTTLNWRFHDNEKKKFTQFNDITPQQARAAFGFRPLPDLPLPCSQYILPTTLLGEIACHANVPLY